MKLSRLIEELTLTKDLNGDMELVGMVDGEIFMDIELNCPGENQPCYIEMYDGNGLHKNTLPITHDEGKGYKEALYMASENEFFSLTLKLCICEENGYIDSCVRLTNKKNGKGDMRNFTSGKFGDALTYYKRQKAIFIDD